MTTTSRLRQVLRIGTLLTRPPALFHLVQGLFFTGQALFDPRIIRTRSLHAQQRLHALGERLDTLDASAGERLALVERLLLEQLPPLLPSMLPLLELSLALPTFAERCVGNLATSDERQTVQRGLPSNPTTEMDLALWALAQQLRTDTTVVALLYEGQSEQVANAYRAGTLPLRLQQGQADFLYVYGHRGVTEIDLGLPRWSEDPTYLIGMLTNYLRLILPEAAPDVHFQQSKEAAEAKEIELTRRATRRSWLRGKLVGFSLERMRALMGLREVPKFDLVLLLSLARRLLLSVGEELVCAGRLEAGEDLFFLNLTEAHFARTRPALQEGKLGKALSGSMEENVLAIRAKPAARHLVRRRGRCLRDYQYREFFILLDAIYQGQLQHIYTIAQKEHG